MNRRHAGRERQCAATAFERGKRVLQIRPSRVSAPRVVELAPFAGPGLAKRAGQMNWRYDRPGRRINLVANMDRPRAKRVAE